MTQKEKEVALKADIEETKEEQVEETKETTTKAKDNAPKTASVNKKVATRKIKAIADIDCYVSQKHYSIAKDAEVEVPTDVAAILVNAKKAFRL